MPGRAKRSPESGVLQLLVKGNCLFRGLEVSLLATYLEPEQIVSEKLYASRPVYTAFRPDRYLEHLYAIVAGGRWCCAVRPSIA